MKAVEGFKIRTLGNEKILVPEGSRFVNFGKMISLNQSAAFLWESIQGKEFTASDLADLLVGEYEVDYETALRDSESIAEKWIEAGIVGR